MIACHAITLFLQWRQLNRGARKDDNKERKAWILLGKKIPLNLKIIIEDESVDGVFKSYHILALARHGDTAVLCVRKSLLFYFLSP